MSTIRALVTRWRKIGSLGRVGPSAAEVSIARASGALVIRIESGKQKMTILLDYENAKRLAFSILSECRKLVKP